MPIDVATGVVTFDDGTAIRPRMPRRDAPPDGRRTLDGHAFEVRLAFDRDEVAEVRLSDAALAAPDPAAARAAHDAWLSARLGPGRPWQAHAYPFGGVEHRYAWGTVGSYAVPQDLAAYLGVAYY